MAFKRANDITLRTLINDIETDFNHGVGTQVTSNTWENTYPLKGLTQRDVETLEDKLSDYMSGADVSVKIMPKKDEIKVWVKDASRKAKLAAKTNLIKKAMRDLKNEITKLKDLL